MSRLLDLQDDGREAFARAFPTIAANLARPLRNPGVEAVAHGLTVLAARVERVLDATAPLAAVHFADLLFPELLRPFPASTIVEVVPTGTAARERHSFPPGLEFEGIAVEGTRARFRAHAPVRLDPWRVEDARLAWSTERGQSLEIVLAPLQVREGLAPPSPLPLRLHVAGEPRSALTLLSSIEERVASIEIVSGEHTVEIPRSALRRWGLRTSEALLPEERLEHPGYRLVRELLILPTKFAFLEIDSDRAPPVPAAPRHTLRLRFETPLPASVQVTRESFRTNCVPVSNTFDTTTDPLRVALERPSHVLRPAGYPPAHAEVYGVRRVTTRLRSGERVEIAEGAAFDGTPGALRGVFYTLHRAAPDPGRAADLSLELEVAADATEPPELDVLTLDVWATNRSLPSALGVGDVRIATPWSPSSCTFRNIVAVTPYRPAPLADDLRWRTLALLGLTTRPIARADSLRTLLHALNLHRTADRQAARAHAQRLEAIAAVTMRAATHPIERGVARGSDVLLELAERAFDSEGEAVLFARVLAQLFAHECSLNSFARTTVRFTGNGRTVAFPPLSEDRTVE
jgi:type VI secretion system protein ImpG